MTTGVLMDERTNERPSITPSAALMRQLHGLSPIARLDLLDAALEAARRQGAAEVLAGEQLLTPADREALHAFLAARAAGQS